MRIMMIKMKLRIPVLLSSLLLLHLHVVLITRGVKAAAAVDDDDPGVQVFVYYESSTLHQEEQEALDDSKWSLENSVILKRRKADDYDMDAYIRSCNFTLDMYPDKVIKIITPFHGRKQYPAGLNCDWEIIGSPACHPVVTCEQIDLRESSECGSLDTLTISDGLRGEKDFCGPGLGFSHGNKGVLGHYLYLTFRTGDSAYFKRLYKGLSCTIRCHISIRLPPNQNALPAIIQHREDSKCVCGKKYDEGNDRIVGGEKAEKNEFPWLVALVMKGTRIPFCGGSLINSRYILTAAHCMLDENYSPMDPSAFEVILRAHILDIGYADNAKDVELGEEGSIRGAGWNETKEKAANPDEIILPVDQVVVHQMYMKYADHDCDISLVRLKKSLSLSAKTTPTPICLPNMENSLSKDYVGTTSVVAGWGKSHELAGASTRHLQKLDVPVLAQATCASFYAEADMRITDNMLCAGFEKGGKDACSGDSGGPLIAKEGNNWVQIGVVSFGIGCAKHHRPGVYTRVTKFLPWIYHHSVGAVWPRTV